MPTNPHPFPTLSELRRDALGSWTGEAVLAPQHRISVMYVALPDTVRLVEIRAVVQERLAHVARNESDLRYLAARAWLATFLSDCEFTRGWDEERLARSFVLRGLILGNTQPTFILEHATDVPVDKVLKTWFRPDGSLSHISGSLY